eukprot:563668-Pleurochrysis_carterae.AAC.1
MTKRPPCCNPRGQVRPPRARTRPAGALRASPPLNVQSVQRNHHLRRVPPVVHSTRPPSVSPGLSQRTSTPRSA